MTHSPTPWTTPFCFDGVYSIRSANGNIIGRTDGFLTDDHVFILEAINSYDQHCEYIEYQTGIIQQLVEEKKEHRALIKQLVKAFEHLGCQGNCWDTEQNEAIEAAIDAGF